MTHDAAPSTTGPPSARPQGEALKLFAPRLLRMSPPPHWHGAESARAATWTWAVAASLPAALGVMLFGAQAVRLLAICLTTALLTETVLRSILRRLTRCGPAGGEIGPALLTGLLVALTLPAGGPTPAWYIPATAALLAILLGHTIFGGHGNQLWHPAAMARVGVELLFGAELVRNVAAGQAADATATPLTTVGTLVAMASGDGRFVEPGRSPITVLIRDYLPPWGMTLFGDAGSWAPGALANDGGVCLGGHVVALIVSALVLGWRGHIRGWCILSGVLAAFTTAFILPIQIGDRLAWLPGATIDEGLPVGLVYVLHQLTAGEFPLVLLLLAGEPVTSPLASRGQRWFGAGIGALTIGFRMLGLATTAGYWALLAMNTLVPLIDRRTRRRVYGT